MLLNVITASPLTNAASRLELFAPPSLPKLLAEPSSCNFLRKLSQFTPASLLKISLVARVLRPLSGLAKSAPWVANSCSKIQLYRVKPTPYWVTLPLASFLVSFLAASRTSSYVQTVLVGSSPASLKAFVLKYITRAELLNGIEYSFPPIV